MGVTKTSSASKNHSCTHENPKGTGAAAKRRKAAPSAVTKGAARQAASMAVAGAGSWCSAAGSVGWDSMVCGCKGAARQP